MTTNICVSIDVGSGYTKAISGDKRISFQSVASPLPEADFFQNKEVEKVKINDKAWLIAESAINSADKGVRADTLQEEWAGSSGWVALLFAALAKLEVKGKIHLITGIPQAQFADKQRRNEIITSLTGKNTFIWKNEQITLDIETCLIIPQAAGAVFCRAAQDETIMDDIIGVVDIGTYTTGLTVMRKGEISNSRSGGRAIGVSDLIGALAQHLEREYFYKMDKADGPQLLLDKYFKNRGKTIDIKEDIKMLSRRVAKPMLDAIDTVWDGGNDLSVYVAGGGAPYFIEPLREVMPHAELMGDNFFAVAHGMMIYLQHQVGIEEAA